MPDYQPVERLPEPFTSPAFWICPVCASGAAERVESCEGYVDIADPQEGETEDTDARHGVVYRPEYVQRLVSQLAALRDEMKDCPFDHSYAMDRAALAATPEEK